MKPDRQYRSRSTFGFGLLETLAVIALISIAATVAIIQLRPTRELLSADQNSNLVMTQTRYARQVAIDQRRNVLITFTAPNRITVTRLESGGGSTVLSDVTLSGGFTFGLPTGTIPDTPEGFGNATAVAFGLATGGTFLGDGTFISAGGLVQNGSVFTIGGGNQTARAVTLTGATGRLKQYSLDGGVWKEAIE